MNRFAMFLTGTIFIAACSSPLFAQTKTVEKTIDTLVLQARLVEIPSSFAPNDLYDYIYVLKYRVLKVLKGTFEDKEIYVGHYNPLIPRRSVKDKMDALVDGDVQKFEKGDVHTLALVTPIEDYWDIIEDFYSNVDTSKKFYALKCDKAK